MPDQLQQLGLPESRLEFLPVRSFDDVLEGRFISPERRGCCQQCGGDRSRPSESKLFPTGSARWSSLCGSAINPSAVVGVLAPKGAVFGSRQDGNMPTSR